MNEGIRVWSRKNHNGRDSYGKVAARVYVHVGCGGCEGVNHLSVARVTVKIAQSSGGPPIEERELTGPKLTTPEAPYSINNWRTNTPALEFNCLNGVEYTFTLTTTIGLGDSRIEEHSVSAKVVCGGGS